MVRVTLWSVSAGGHCALCPNKKLLTDFHNQALIVKWHNMTLSKSSLGFDSQSERVGKNKMKLNKKVEDELERSEIGRGNAEGSKKTQFKKGCKKSKATRKKMGEARKKETGSKNHNWKGGRMKDRGYVLIKMREHPQANYNGYVRENRLVMEQHLGRFLNPKEVVHHINGIKDDNRIENLELTTLQNHCMLHHPKGFRADLSSKYKTWEDLNHNLLEVLDKYFPKGDRARGRALAMFAIAQIELEKKDKEIKELKEILDDSDIVYGDDAKRFIKNMEREEKGKLSKKDIVRLKRFEELMKMSHQELKEKMFTEDGKPKCSICGKPMENAYDTILKKKSKYLWKLVCNCCKNKNFRLSVG